MLTHRVRNSLRTDPLIFKQGRKLFSKHFLLYIKKQQSPYISVIVAKKQVPLATQRNYLKRKMKAALQVAISNKPNITIIALPRKTLVQQPFSELVTELVKMFNAI